MPCAELLLYELCLELDLDDLSNGRKIGRRSRPMAEVISSLDRHIAALVRGVELGIDLKVHLRDIQRLTTWQAGRWCLRNNVSIDELISDVCLRIAVRNNGTCPFDRSKGTLATYIVMQVKQAIANHARAASNKTATLFMVRQDDLGNDVVMDVPVFERFDERVDARRKLEVAFDRDPEMARWLDEADGKINRLKHVGLHPLKAVRRREAMRG